MTSNHPRFSDTLIPHKNYPTESVSDQEGEFLWKLIRENNYQKTIEIGCALGVSSLYICDALSQSSSPSHLIIDPNQTSEYACIGIDNLQVRGIDFFSLVEEPSELALPKLLDRKEIFDFGFIDSWHTFDHTLLEFFYLNRLVRIGGMIVFHDADYPSITKLLGYLSQYPSYKVILPSDGMLKVSQLTLRQQFFRFLILGSRLFPESIRKEIFSGRVISGQVQGSSPSNIVALMKIAEDKRNYDWFEPF